MYHVPCKMMYCNIICELSKLHLSASHPKQHVFVYFINYLCSFEWNELEHKIAFLASDDCVNLKYLKIEAVIDKQYPIGH